MSLVSVLRELGARLAARGLSWPEARQVVARESIVDPELIARATAEFGENGAAAIYEDACSEAGPAPEALDFDAMTCIDAGWDGVPTRTGPGLTVRQLVERLWAMMIEDGDVGEMRVVAWDGSPIDGAECAAMRQAPVGDEDFVVRVR